jgi:AcrR family transcriptional regulator
MVSRARARKAEDKRARRESILDEALRMWEEVSYPDFTMNALAHRLGLAKGTLYLYFRTKEELFLTLYEGLLQAWFDELEAVLATTGPWSPERVAQIIAAGLERHPALVRLVPLLEGLLEHNISPQKARAYKTWLLGEVTRVGEKLERALPYLAAGDGVRVLIYIQALISGLSPMSRPAPVIAQLMADSDLGVLRVEFIPTFERGLAALLRGLKPKLSRTAQMG